MKKIIFISFLLLLVGCCVQQSSQQTSEQQIAQSRASWIGRSEQDIYQHSYWGIPDRSWNDGRGGKILEYRRSRSAYTQTYGYLSVTWITTFFIGSDGKIYDFKARQE